MEPPLRSAWWRQLRRNPPPGVPIYENLGYARHVGWMPYKRKSCKVRQVGSKPTGSLIEEFDPDVRSKVSKIKFSVTNPDFRSEFKQLDIITENNLMQPPTLPEDLLQHAEKLLIEILRDEGVYSDDIPVTDVEYNRNGSVGYWLNEMFKSKGELVDLSWLDINYPAWREWSHVYNWQVPYTISGKVEILKDSKVQDNNMRLFQFSHAYHYFSCAQDNQRFNKTLYGCKWLIAVGKRFQYGGLDELVRKFLLGRGIDPRIFIAGDVTKWDKHFICFCLYMCYRVRCALYRGSDPEYKARMWYQYIQDMYAYLILSNGQVIQIFGSQLSGRVNTTSDNCLAHEFVLICMVLFHCFTDYRKANVKDIKEMLMGLIYADDNLLSLNARINFLSDYDTRAEFYSYFQWGLKKEDDLVSNTVVGQTFLGAKIMEYNGYYVPQYKEDRLMAGVLLKKNELTAEQEYGKIIALYVLGAFCSSAFTNYCYQYLKMLHVLTSGRFDLTALQEDDDLVGISQMVKVFVAHKVPKVEEVRRFFWLNLEGRSAWSPSDLGPNWMVIASNCQN